MRTYQAFNARGESVRVTVPGAEPTEAKPVDEGVPLVDRESPSYQLGRLAMAARIFLTTGRLGDRIYLERLVDEQLGRRAVEVRR